MRSKNNLNSVTMKSKKVKSEKLSNLSLTETIGDLYCDTKNLRVITFQEVCQAAFVIKGGVEATPCRKSHLSDLCGMEIFIKMEFLQFTGSFKERSARNVFSNLTAEQRKLGVISASHGNQALALSNVAMKLEVPVTVVMPKETSIMKIEKCRRFRADVIVDGKDIEESKKIAKEYSKEHGLLYINAYDHPHIIAGQGTIGLEIAEQCPEADAIVVSVGGGGLVAGIATAIKNIFPRTKIIGVESESCASFSKALENGAPVYTPSQSTIAEGLAVSKVGENALATAKLLLDKMIIVKEDWIALAMLRLVEQEKIVVEGAGAVGLAAVLSGQLDEFKGKRVVLILCSGNIDTISLGRCLERGLATDGRLIRVTLMLLEKGSTEIKDFCCLVATCSCEIRDLKYERAWIRDNMSVEVTAVVEAASSENMKCLKETLKNSYKNVVFTEASLSDNFSQQLTEKGTVEDVR